MPTYPPFDGRTPLTKEVANALASQAQGNSRRDAGRDVNLTTVGGAVYQSARGRTANGLYAKLTRGTQVDGVTYYDWVEQDRGVYGLWRDHSYGLTGSFADTPAVEKTNRPGVLGDVVFLRRIPGDLSQSGRQQLMIFDSTFPGVWGTPDPFSTTGGFYTATPQGPWDWAGASSAFSTPGGTPGFWYTPDHPDGTVQSWTREALPTPGGGTSHRAMGMVACQFSGGAFSLLTDSAFPARFPPFADALSYDSTSLIVDTTDPRVGDAVIAGFQANFFLPSYPDGSGPPVWDFIATVSLAPTAGGDPGCSVSRHLYGYPPGSWSTRLFFPFDRYFTPSSFGMSFMCVIPSPRDAPLAVTASLTTSGPNAPAPSDLSTFPSAWMWLEYPYNG